VRQFPLGVTLVEHAEWAAAQGRRQEATDLAAEAAEIFRRLDATPWPARAVAVSEEPTRVSA
jgi:hypothetical protein